MKRYETNDFIIQMFEEKSSFQVTRNQKQNGGNRLMAHFQNSSFLAQQQQLSMFVKNMPIIRIQQVHSLNRLIQLLIRQNQALGTRCQQNVLTVKQMFAKHEELLKTNRQIQQQLTDSTKMVQYHTVNQQQTDSYEQQLSRYKEELARLKDQLTVTKSELGRAKEQASTAEETMGRLSSQTSQLLEKNKQLTQWQAQTGQFIRLLGERSLKRCLQRIKDWGGRWEELDCIDKFLREQRRRSKCLPKVRETVQLFCIRLLKVLQLLGVHNARQQFQKEVSNLLQILDELLITKGRSTLANSHSRLQSAPQGTFFQSMLSRIIKQSQSGTASREEIAVELHAVRSELQECKSYYEQYLITAKMQFESVVREKDEEITTKEEQIVQKTHLVQFYEGEREMTTRQQIDTRNRLLQLEEMLKAERVQLMAKEEELAGLQGRVDCVKSQGALRQKQLREQWDQNINTFQYRLAQKQDLLEQEQKQRRAVRLQLEEVITQLKSKLADMEEREKSNTVTNRELAQTNRQLVQTIEKLQKQADQESLSVSKQLAERTRSLQQVNRKREKQLNQLKKTKDDCQSLQKQKALQTAYIAELQSRNKQLLSKMKSLQSKKTQQKTAKKQMTAIKQTMAQQKKYMRQLQQSLQLQREDCQRQREDNQRLKGVIKDMKRELQGVYHQFNQLKTIESDRERLLGEMERSDRSHQEVIKGWEAARTQTLRLQQENRALALEVKHCRGALNRIEALRI